MVLSFHSDMNDSAIHTFALSALPIPQVYSMYEPCGV